MIKKTIKKYIFMALGFISLAIAYIGFITPGIPFSIFLVFSAYCFAKSNKKMERWLYNHPWFGKFLTNWTPVSYTHLTLPTTPYV